MSTVMVNQWLVGPFMVGNLFIQNYYVETDDFESKSQCYHKGKGPHQAVFACLPAERRKCRIQMLASSSDIPFSSLTVPLHYMILQVNKLSPHLVMFLRMFSQLFCLFAKDWFLISLLKSSLFEHVQSSQNIQFFKQQYFGFFLMKYILKRIDLVNQGHTYVKKQKRESYAYSSV